MFKRVHINQWVTTDLPWYHAHYEHIKNILTLFKEPYRIIIHKKFIVITFKNCDIYPKIPEFQAIIDTIHNLYAGGVK